MKRLYVVRKQAPAFLPEGFKTRKNRTVEGIAKTGEISHKGIVGATEDWEGRVAGDVGAVSMRYINDRGHIRKMTFREQVDRGYIIPGRGPVGVKVKGPRIENR